MKEMHHLYGNNGLHGLPDFSHSKPNRIYVKLDPRGFREMRAYGDDGKVVLEIGFHPEKNLTGNSHIPVLHYHYFGVDLKHLEAKPMSKEVYDLYKEYLNHWGIYWNEQD